MNKKLKKKNAYEKIWVKKKNTPRLGFILLLLLFNLIIICAYITEIIRKSIFRLAMLGINLSPKIEEIEK